MTEQERNLIRDAMMFAVKDINGRVMREATVQSMIDDFKKDINYTHCCTELPNEQDETEYWVDLVNWEGGGIEEVSNTNLIVFKKEIDLEIQRRLKK